jgi:hypothetical protein
MKLLRSATIVSFVTLAAACAEGTDDGAPLGSTRATDLATTEAALFVVTRTDESAMYAARVGRPRTTCADRIERRTCEVAELDLSRADLFADDEGTARMRIRDGAAIVRAKLVSNAAELPRVGRLVVSEVWLRDAAAPSLLAEPAQTDATFVLRDVREGCEAWLRAEPVGGGRAAHYTTLDLSAIGGALSEANQRALSEGGLMARGVGVGDAFIAVSLYARAFVVPPSAAPTDPDTPPLR